MTAKPTPRTVLVTGGGGFIGSHLVERLTAEGASVVVIDNFSTGRRVNLAAVPSERVQIIDADVSTALPDLDPDAFDAIFHLAAAVGVRLVIEEPIRTIETNVHETSAILRFAATRATPLLLASTSEVYGKSTKTPFAEDDDVVYGPTTLHRWSYACSKAIDEYLALAYHREQGLPVTIARLFNTVGPRQVGAYGMVLPRFTAAALEGQPLQVHGDGKQTRCFCDVRDVVEQLLEIVERTECYGRVFNVGNDEPIDIESLAMLVIRTLGSDSAIEKVPYDKAFGAGFDDLRDRRPDLTRLRSVTGFTPRIDLQTTIRDLAASLAPVSPERA
ncbi:MAG: NAD-dependent epimerase/dehydratase family protein [Phycisphaerales bacterium]|nr:NAD-dependent epimerase/dehydratase family protein [Phycisphaerales bacterium]